MRTIRLSFVATCFVLLSACDAGPHRLRLVTPTEPVDRSITEELSDLLDNDANVEIQLTAAPLSEDEALEAVASGDADIALVSNSLPFRSDIATVMPLYPTVLHIGHLTGKTPSRGLEMLRGAKIFAGPEGSASRHVLKRIATRMNLEEDEYRYVDHFDDAPDVIIIFAPVSPERINEIRELWTDFPELRLSSIGTPEDIGTGQIIDTAVLLNPHFQTFVIPVGTYGDLTEEPIVTVAVDKILVARSDLESAVVYKLINEILRLRPALAAKRPGLFQHLPDDFDASRSRFILHAGTQAYLQRDAPTLMERYSGVAEVVVTLFVALASALFAMVRILRVRRKNRIDTFYSRARELRRSVSASASAQERQQVVDRLRQLQSEAFDMLIDEKLAADESFRIFITLSNDLMHQLGATNLTQRLSDT